MFSRKHWIKYALFSILGFLICGAAIFYLDTLLIITGQNGLANHFQSSQSFTYDWENIIHGIEGFTIGGLILIAIYHLALFTVRREDSIPLYFGLFCLFFGIYNIFMSSFGDYLFEFLGYNYALKLRYIAGFIIVPLFLLYLKSLYSDLIPSIAVKISMFIFTVYFVLLLFVPANYFFAVMKSYNIIYVLAILYCCYVLLQGIQKRRIGAKLLLIMFFLFFLTVLFDIYCSFSGRIMDLQLAPIGFLLFIGAHSYVLSMRFAKAFRDVENLSNEIIKTQKEVIYYLGNIAEGRSKETGNHVKRVAEYSRLLAEKIGLPEREVELIKLASPMHDIGKIAIPDTILKKPGKLTTEEFEIMITHTTIGYDLLKHSNGEILQCAAEIALTHHEKWDGTGYPNGLKGEEIPITGRIIAIADVFDALGSPRVYKQAWTLDEILNYFKEQKGGHFDPQLVDIFFDNLEQFLEIREQYSDDNGGTDHQIA